MRIKNHNKTKLLDINFKTNKHAFAFMCLFVFDN